jgi:TonB family protein
LLWNGSVVGRFVQLGVVAALTAGVPVGAAQAEEALLSVAQANVVASAQHEQVKRCYFRHALIEPRSTGQVRVDVFVRSDGVVSRARVDAPGVKRRAFERCVVARAMTWRFPVSAGPTEVRMPFRFHVPVRLRSRASS